MADRRGVPEATMDLLKTQMQETGRCPVNGLAWPEVYEIIDTLGIDPWSVLISGGWMFVREADRA